MLGAADYNTKFEFDIGSELIIVLIIGKKNHLN
jgi:hypothetical protein